MAHAHLVVQENTSFKERPTVWVTSPWPEAVEDALCKEFNVILNRSNRAMTEDELTSALQNADALLLSDREATEITALYINQPRAKLIANYSANHGTDYSSIDITTASRHGIAVTNTPTDSASQHDLIADQNAITEQAISLMLTVSDRADQTEPKNVSDVWNSLYSSVSPNKKLAGKTLGIIGFNDIGQAVAKRAHLEFGMEILAYDPHSIGPDVLRSCHAVATPSIDALLPCIDYLLLHDIDDNNSNTCLIDAVGLNLMKATAYLIHTAQNFRVDQQALMQALWFESIAGAGLCLDQEKFQPDQKSCVQHLGFNTCENAVVVPQIYRQEAPRRETDGIRIVQNIKDFFAGKRPLDLVE